MLIRSLRERALCVWVYVFVCVCECVYMKEITDRAHARTERLRVGIVVTVQVVRWPRRSSVLRLRRFLGPRPRARACTL